MYGFFPNNILKCYKFDPKTKYLKMYEISLEINTNIYISDSISIYKFKYYFYIFIFSFLKLN